MSRPYGIVPNRVQFLHQLLQVFLVGLTLGMMRTVVPALAESDFGVPKNSFVLLSAFVLAFGLVKGSVNAIAGRWSERFGRQRVLLLGWAMATPIPLMVWHAPSWNWIVAATVLLGCHQGLTWSMTQTAQLDITRPDERGLTIGLNEFAGYVGMALAGVLTAYVVDALGVRQGLLVFGLVVIVLALLLAGFAVQDTRPWAQAQAQNRADAATMAAPSTWQVFALMSWRDKRLMALCQAGLVEKFVDALVWIFYPVFLSQQGVSLPQVGWVISAYGLTWGALQLFTGRWSDHIGRHRLNVWGMWTCGAGVALMPLGHGVAWWAGAAALSGGGMALLYPNLSAAVADIAHPSWRGSAIGIYRFWRDLGYGIGALGLGLSAHFAGQLQAAFWFVACAMLGSGALLWCLGEETHPRLSPGPRLRDRR